MTTRHQYVETTDMFIITDDNNEFWAADLETEGGFSIRLDRDGDCYIAKRHDANYYHYGKVGYGDTMDEALADMLA